MKITRPEKRGSLKLSLENDLGQSVEIHEEFCCVDNEHEMDTVFHLGSIPNMTKFEEAIKPYLFQRAYGYELQEGFHYFYLKSEGVISLFFDWAEAVRSANLHLGGGSLKRK